MITTNLIQKELSEIEIQEGVKILYACESGSRAWGFASQDSDYDVRFIYVRPMDWYLSIQNRRDVVEKFKCENKIDLSGWDLRKALQLLAKSNPPLLEWLQSPIVYKSDLGFLEEFRDFSRKYFSLKACIYHYLHMATGNSHDELYIGKERDQVKLKKYFYVLRPLLACRWMEKYATPAPIEFERLLKFVSEKALHEVERLLARKRNSLELDIGPRIRVLDEFIAQEIEYFTNRVGSLLPGLGVADDLDGLFRKYVKVGPTKSVAN